MNIIKSSFTVTTLCVLASTTSLIRTGLAAGGETTTYTYPELTVVPRASDRIAMEAKKESETRWTRLLPIQVSALTTLTSGIFHLTIPQPKTLTPVASAIGIGVGGAWLGTTVLLSVLYTPYLTAETELKEFGKKSPREELTRERLAEESLDQAASLGRKLTWLSFASNFLTSGLLLYTSDFNHASVGVAAGSLLASFTPLLFPTRWQNVSCEQREYKKKIYAPIASATLFKDPSSSTSTWAPGLQLSFRW